MAFCRYCINTVLSDGMACDACWAVVQHVPLNVPLVAEKIGIPSDRWQGNCHSVATAMSNRFGEYELPGCRVRRGWITALNYAGQHSWLELDRGIIVDPTLRANEGKAPEVRVWKPLGDVYDPCGWRTVHSVVQPCPSVFDTDRELVQLELGSVDYVAGLINNHVEDGYVELSKEQAIWLANLPVRERESARVLSRFFAAEVYEALQAAGLKAFIPVDAWHYVMDVPYRGERVRRTPTTEGTPR